MDFLSLSLPGFDEFLVYFGLAIPFVAIFLVVYSRLTPCPEFKLIREDNPAAAASLAGVLLGFTLPLASASVHSVHPKG